MSENSNHIDKLIQQKLKGHQVKTPESAWNRLRDDLHRPARTRFFWITRSAAAAMLLLIAFGAGYFFSELNRDADTRLTNSWEPLKEKGIEKEIAKPQPVEDPVAVVNESITTSTEKASSKLQQIPTINALIADGKQKVETDASTNNQTPTAKSEETIKPLQPFHGNDVENELTDPVEARETKEALAEQKKEIPPQGAQSGEDTQQSEVPVMTDEMLHEMLIADDDLVQGIQLKNDETKRSNWSVGAMISPVYSYRTISGDAFTGTDDAVDAGYFNDNEEGITTIAGGISMDFNFNNRLSLGSGMFFSRIGQQNNDVLAYNDPQTSDLYKLATSTGTITVNPRSFENVIVEQQAASPKDSIPGDYFVNSSLVQNLDYLEVPLVLKYKVIDSRVSVNVKGGLSPGILVNNRSYFTVEGQKLQTGTTENINNFIYNSILGLGLEYAISRKVAISMEPSFKYSLSPVNSGTGLEYHPYSLSWFTGISYTLD